MSFKSVFFKIFTKKQQISDEEVEKNSKYLRRFGKEIIKPNLPKIIIAIIFMAGFAATNAGTAWLIKPIVNNMFVVRDMKDVYKISSAIVGLSLAKGLSQYIYSSLLSAVSITVISTARYNLFKAFLKQDLTFFHNNPPGKLLSAINNEINAINNLATTVPINLGRDLLTFIGLVAVMFIQQPVYSLVIILAIFFIIIPIRVVNKKLKKYFAQTNSGLSSLNSRAEQVFSGIKEIKSYNMENREQINAQKILDNISKTQQKVRKVTMILPSTTELLAGLSVGAILMYGGYAIIHQNADPGTFFAFIAALLLAYQPLKRLSEVSTTIQLGLLGVKKYYKYLDNKPKVISSEKSIIADFKEVRLAFNNVSFHYTEKKPVLTNINFDIKPGEKIALVGRSGGGKSTIINLIERFYDPTKGTITINGVNIKDFSLLSLRKHIAYVGQDLALFDDTIYNNISYGNRKASEEDIYKAAEQANCTDFIENMPNKFATEIGARGIRLSGGQRQRIAIARAILKNAPLLLLDEATSALDSESEKAIQDALDHLMQGRTTISIAHRLSTIINADKILVIDKGHIIERGNHKELMEKEGFYKFLYNLQSMGNI